MVFGIWDIEGCIKESQSLWAIDIKKANFITIFHFKTAIKATKLGTYFEALSTASFHNDWNEGNTLRDQRFETVVKHDVA